MAEGSALTKADKRKLKFERKQERMQAAAEANGMPFEPPQKRSEPAEGQPGDIKMGKRKKRKLREEAAEAQAAGEADGGQSLAAPAAGEEAAAAERALSKAARKALKQQRKQGAAGVAQPPTAAHVPLVNGAAAAAAGTKAERKASKKRKVEADGAAASLAAAPDAAVTEPVQLSKAKKKSLQKQQRQKPLQAAPAAAEAAVAGRKSKKPKLAASSAVSPITPLLANDSMVSPAAVLAAIGSVEAAKAGKPVQRVLCQPQTAGSKDAATQAWQQQHSIVVTGCSAAPVLRFEDTGFDADLTKATAGFAQPSPIQAQCWPIIAAGRDLVGIAATGSGKTLAFGLPALQHCRVQKAAGVATGKGPSVLILSPTRELAQQIAEVLQGAGGSCGLKTLCVYGGVAKPPQISALRKGVDVVVATPGRLEDLVNDKACRLAGVTYLVLDEADRMLDLGFEPHIRAIAQQTRADRHTLMFSATWPSSIQKLAAEFLADPARVTIGSEDLSASHSVTQIVEVLEQHARDRRLDELLKRYHGNRKDRVLVFVLYKKEAGRVEAMLQKKGWKAVAVHGDISQHQRTAAVEQFKSGQAPLLVATDVAARGLDIPDVGAVINYSYPLTTEDYVHRIGRTGRAGKTGISHTFFCGASDKGQAGGLINVLREAGQEVPKELLAFGTTVKKKESKLYGAHFKDIDPLQKSTKISFDDDD